MPSSDPVALNRLPSLGVLLASLPARLATALADGLEAVLSFSARRLVALLRSWQEARFAYRLSLMETEGDLGRREYRTPEREAR